MAVPVMTAAEFAAWLAGVSAAIIPATTSVVNKGAKNIKDESRQNVQRSAPIHNAHAYQFIDYDLRATPAAIEAEIGYNKNQRPAAIGNLLEFGGGKDRSPAHRDIGRATDNEEPRFISEMTALGTRLLT